MAAAEGGVEAIECEISCTAKTRVFIKTLQLRLPVVFTSVILFLAIINHRPASYARAEPLATRNSRSYLTTLTLKCLTRIDHRGL